MRRLVLFVLLSVGLLLPAATSRAADPLTYDSDRVMGHVRALAETIGSRPAGSVNEGRAAGYIAGQFAAVGLDVRVHPFEIWDDQLSQNIIATLPGNDPGYGIIYIGAHYDSVARGPGANDNASGTAVLLELARLLAVEDLNPTVVFAAFGAEEVGLVGSTRYVWSLPTMDRIMALGMINLDCVGVGSRYWITTEPRADTSLVERAAAQAANLGLTVEARYDPWGRSDHGPFVQFGIPAAFLSTRDESGWCGPYYHKPTDTPETLDPINMERIAQIALATVRDLAADAPLRQPTQIWLPLIAP